MSALAQNILTLRKLRNLTQMDLAKLSGTTGDCISKLERRVFTNAGIEYVTRIAAALKTTPSKLCSDELRLIADQTNLVFGKDRKRFDKLLRQLSKMISLQKSVIDEINAMLT